MITVMRNNFDNGWIGFDERTSSRLVASEESSKPVILTLRRQSSVRYGQLVVSFVASFDVAEQRKLIDYIYILRIIYAIHFSQPQCVIFSL